MSFHFNRLNPDNVPRIAPQAFDDLTESALGKNINLYRLNLQNSFLHFLQSEHDSYSGIEIYLKDPSGAITRHGFCLYNIPEKLSEHLKVPIQEYLTAPKNKSLPKNTIPAEDIYSRLLAALEKYNRLQNTRLQFVPIENSSSGLKHLSHSSNLGEYTIQTKLASDFKIFCAGEVKMEHLIHIGDGNEKLAVTIDFSDEKQAAKFQFVKTGSGISTFSFIHKSHTPADGRIFNLICNKAIELYLCCGYEAVRSYLTLQYAEQTKLLLVDTEKFLSIPVLRMVKSLNGINTKSILNKPALPAAEFTYDFADQNNQSLRNKSVSRVNKFGVTVTETGTSKEFFRITLNSGSRALEISVSKPEGIFRCLKLLCRNKHKVLTDLKTFLTSDDPADFEKAFGIIKKSGLKMEISNSAYRSEILGSLISYINKNYPQSMHCITAKNFTDFGNLKTHESDTKAFLLETLQGREWLKIKLPNQSSTYANLGIRSVQLTIDSSNEGFLLLKRDKKDIRYALPKKFHLDMADYLTDKADTLANSPAHLIEEIINEISQHEYPCLQDGVEVNPIVILTSEGEHAFDINENLALNYVYAFYSLSEELYELEITPLQNVKVAKKEILNFENELLSHYTLQAANTEQGIKLEFDVCSKGLIAIRSVSNKNPTYVYEYIMPSYKLDDALVIFNYCLKQLTELSASSTASIELHAYLAGLAELR